MKTLSSDPLDAGQRKRRRRVKLRSTWAWRVLRNRRVLIVVLSVAKAIVKLARLIGEFFGDS